MLEKAKNFELEIFIYNFRWGFWKPFQKEWVRGNISISDARGMVGGGSTISYTVSRVSLTNREGKLKTYTYINIYISIRFILKYTISSEPHTDR